MTGITVTFDLDVFLEYLKQHSNKESLKYKGKAFYSLDSIAKFIKQHSVEVKYMNISPNDLKDLL